MELFRPTAEQLKREFAHAVFKRLCSRNGVNAHLLSRGARQTPRLGYGCGVCPARQLRAAGWEKFAREKAGG
jgi:hypothetical protein